MVISALTARRGPLPLRIIVQRKNLLYALGPIVACGTQQLDGLGDSAQTRVVGDAGGVLTAAYAVEYCRQVEDPGAGFEKKCVQGFAGW